MKIDNQKELPERNNFYASFSDISKTRIKQELMNNNWECRKASWDGYELTNSWSILMLEGEEDEPLLNGMVRFNQDNMALLDKLFSGLKGQFRYEFYDHKHVLVLEKKSNGE